MRPAGSPALTTGPSMLHGKNIIVVMPAYHAEKTLAACYGAIPHDIVDEVLLVDDASDDATVAVAERLGIRTVRHPANRGYGGNQKTCYALALERGADVVVMLHPDYQYEPRLITAMAAMVASGVYDVVIGSRILGNTALAGGMPRYKYFANRFLTAAQNFLVGSKLSEFHTGYRAFSRRVLETLPLARNSDDFVFDNQMLVQALAFGFPVGEISCPTRYFAEASQINFRRSVVYGCGVLWTAMLFRLWKWKLASPNLFSSDAALRLHANAPSDPLTHAKS
ncbi:MAG TPA: glycosyltransferase family 2 protein [Rhodanobacteraceae bacterium]